MVPFLWSTRRGQINYGARKHWLPPGSKRCVYVCLISISILVEYVELSKLIKHLIFELLYVNYNSIKKNSNWKPKHKRKMFNSWTCRNRQSFKGWMGIRVWQAPGHCSALPEDGKGSGWEQRWPLGRCPWEPPPCQAPHTESSYDPLWTAWLSPFYDKEMGTETPIPKAAQRVDETRMWTKATRGPNPTLSRGPPPCGPAGASHPALVAGPGPGGMVFLAQGVPHPFTPRNQLERERERAPAPPREPEVHCPGRFWLFI